MSGRLDGTLAGRSTGSPDIFPDLFVKLMGPSPPSPLLLARPRARPPLTRLANERTEKRARAERRSRQAERTDGRGRRTNRVPSAEVSVRLLP